MRFECLGSGRGMAVHVTGKGLSDGSGRKDWGG